VGAEDVRETFRRLLGRRFGLAAPATLVKVGAPLLGSSASLALTGRRGLPTRLEAEGFAFAEPDFEPVAAEALRALR